MTRIIAFIDGSIYAKSVCDHVAWMAGRLGEGVDLVHALAREKVSGVPANLSGNIGLGARSALLEELVALDADKARLAQQRGRVILAQAQELLSGSGLSDVSVKLRNGDLLETIEELEAAASFIVIGKRGEGADFATGHLGSNLERVVRASHHPVLVASRAFKPIEKFLIAFDGGPSALKAVDHVSRSPLFSGLECRLLHVGDGTPEARKKLEGAAEQLRAGGFTVSADIRPGQPEKVIGDAVEQDGIDLVVMGAYGHSRVRNLIIGSTTSELIRTCKVPVVLFR